MKKTLVFALVLGLLAALLLTGCGEKPMFNVTTNDDNAISITGKKAPAGSLGLGYLTVGADEAVVIDFSFTGEGMLRFRMMDGVLGDELFPDEPAYESTLLGPATGTMRFTVEPGEYTVGVLCERSATVTAVMHTGVQTEEEAALAAANAEGTP